MKKLSAVLVLLVIFGIAIVALAPAASADGIVYTEASVNPKVINPGNTTTVTLRAMANTTTEKREVDVVLVTDLSGSMNSAKLSTAKDALKTFVGLANNKVYIGLASFGNADKPYSNATWEKWLDQKDNATSPFHPYAGCDDKSKTSPNAYHSNAHNGYSDAHIDVNFTQDKTTLNNTIDNYNANGGTNIAGGINAAKKMLEEQGTPGHLQVIVIMSDGIATMAPIEPDLMDAYMPCDWDNGKDRSETARTAAVKASGIVKNKDITVFAIGFGSDADEETLMAVASTGNYYPADVADIAEIYGEISEEIKKITGARAYHVLPADVEYVEGSASAEPIVSGQTLEWIIGDLAPDAPWDVTFDVKPLNLGGHSVNVVPDSEVTYTSGSIPGSVSFPALFVAATTLPVADFRWTPEKPHTSKIVTFDASNSSDPDGGSIVSYEWSGSFEATGKIVTHVFGSEGNYVVTLTVTDDDEESKKVSKVVTIDDNLRPVAVAKARRNMTDKWQYEHVTVSQYEPVMFDGSDSHDPDGYIVNYQWTFGDGNKSTLAGPLHVYWENGTYNVNLIVEDNRGTCEDTLAITVTQNSDFHNSFANKSSNFNIEEGDAYDIITGKPVSIIGKSVNIVVNTTDSSVVYSVFIDDYKIAIGNASGMGNFMWISMSSGKHKITVRVDIGGYQLEWVIDVVNVWIKQVT
jgi:PKD repeat protein